MPPNWPFGDGEPTQARSYLEPPALGTGDQYRPISGDMHYALRSAKLVSAEGGAVAGSGWAGVESLAHHLAHRITRLDGVANIRRNRRWACYASPKPRLGQPGSRSGLCGDPLSTRSPGRSGSSRRREQGFEPTVPVADGARMDWRPGCWSRCLRRDRLRARGTDLLILRRRPYSGRNSTSCCQTSVPRNRSQNPRAYAKDRPGRTQSRG